MSYPALYTHKRNKHNIIGITGKEAIFKKYAKATKSYMKFKYSAIENDNYDSTNLFEIVFNIFKQLLTNLFTNEKCLLFKSNFNFESYGGVIQLKQMKHKIHKKGLIPQKDSSIDEAFIIYIINFAKVTQNTNLIEAIIKFIVLLRENINIVGPEHKERVISFGINLNSDNRQPYSKYNTCQDLPEFVNDFISVFVPLDELFFIELDELLDLTNNFCNWLFVNNLTNLKIAPNTPTI